MKTFKYIVLTSILVSAIFLSSCEKWFSQDISEETPILLSPYDSLSTNSNAVQFWWEEMLDATKYKIQIVSPCFNRIEKLILDSTISETNFQVSLSPGEYEWRVRAENDAYFSEYASNHLFIDSTNNLNDLSIILLDPVSNEYFNDFEIYFNWGDIDIADIYRFEVHIDSWEGDNLFMPLNLEESECTILFEEEGIFYWGVQASNANSTTAYETRQFEIDTTSPQVPTILNPSNDTIYESELVQAGIHVSWSHPDNSGSPILDSIQFYNDSLGTQLLVSQLTQDTIYLYNNSLQYQAYYFRIKSIDLAGNIGEWSELFQVFYEE
jgi:hypothetical protein